MGSCGAGYELARWARAVQVTNLAFDERGEVVLGVGHVQVVVAYCLHLPRPENLI